jgi:aspartate ammonia-lyase
MSSFSGALRSLALELIRIANDLRLLGSGPHSGLGEIHLPAVQPGSSIMPGKVNPVMAECLDMVAFQVVAHDTAVSLAAQAGQMELNVMTPVMTYNILESLAMLTSFLPARGTILTGLSPTRRGALPASRETPCLLILPRIGCRSR